MNSSEKPSPTFNRETDASEFLGLNLEAVRGLANFIDLSEGFRVAIAEVNFAPDVDILIQALQQRPECQQVQFLVFDFSHQKIPSLLTELVERLATVKPEADKKPVIILRGLETSIGGLGNESPFLQDLNFVRDALARRVSYPMVFILPKYALKRFARQARDFWSWASTVFEFRSARERIETVQTSVLQADSLSGSYRKPVKQSRIDQLNSLLEEYAPTEQDSDVVNADIRLDILIELGEAHLSLLQNKPAEQCFSAAIALAQGSEKPLYEARANMGLAEALYLQGHYGEAEPLLQAALEMQQALLGEAHPAVATSLNDLAVLYQSQGRYAEAEPLYQQALALRKALLGEAHPNVAASLNNLAELYRSQGRYSEAEPLYQQALEMWQALLGDSHPNVASSLNNLALLYQSQGRYAEAEPLYQQALALRKALLGEAHPDVATSLNDLAALYQSQGRYAEAEPLYQQALALMQVLLGEAHPAVATSLNNLAELYRSQGRYTEAEPLYQKSLTLRQALLGEDHPDVATSLNNLALLYQLQGRYAEAEPLYQQALALMQVLLGGEHPDVATSLNNLAGLYQSQERYTEAEPLAVQALQTSVNVLGANHPDVGINLGNLASLRVAQGTFEDVEAMFLQALSIFVNAVGAEHPYTTETFNRLAQFVAIVHEAGQAHILSDHPLTQDLLRQLQQGQHSS